MKIQKTMKMIAAAVDNARAHTQRLLELPTGQIEKRAGSFQVEVVWVSLLPC